MRANRATLTRRPGSWQHLLLAALLIAAQMLLGMHGLDHLDAGTSDSCDICLVGQHLGHAVTGHTVAAPQVPNTVPRAPAADAALTEQPAPSPCQRGPPRALRIA